MTSFDPEILTGQQASLRALAAAIVGDSHADDVLQDTWLAALSSDWGQPDRWPAWLRAVTRNLAWKRRIRDDRRHARERTASKAEALSSPDELVAQIEEGHLVERALTRLDEPYRSTLLWCFYEDLSVAEISRRSGIPESTTRTHLQRGLEKLRERLKSERGPEWRAALLPLLGRTGAPSLAAAGGFAGLGALSMSTFSKPLILTCVLLGAWMLRDYASGIAPEPAVSSGLPASNSGGLAPSEPVLLEVAKVEPEQRHAMAEEPVLAGLQAPGESAAPAAPVAVRRLFLKDPRSELGIPYANIVIEHNGPSHALRTDEQGWLQLPDELFREDRRMPQRRLRLQLVLPRIPQSLPIHGTLLPKAESADFEFCPEGAWAFQVQLPVSLQRAKISKYSARASYAIVSGSTLFHSESFAPIHRHGRMLTFVLPAQLDSDNSRGVIESISLMLTSPDAAQVLEVELPADANLASGPYTAQASSGVTQDLRILESVSGLPVEGAFLSIRALGRPSSKPMEWANGYSDGDGRMRLSGLPAGKQQLIMNKQGYDLTIQEIEIRPGAGIVELRLREIPGRSDLKVTISARAGRELPSFVGLSAHLLPLKNVQGSGVLHPQSKRGGRWSESTILEGLPPGRYELRVNSNLPGVGTREAFLVDVPSPPVVIDLGAPTPSRPLMLRLPSRIARADFWIGTLAGLGPRLLSSGCSDGSRVAVVAERDDPRMWLVTCAGHVPAYGGSEAWKSARSNQSSGPAFALRPKLEPGWGVLVHVQGPAGAVAGATLEDLASGTILGKTDERGLVLVRSERAIKQLRVVLGERRSQALHVGQKPFLQAYLPKAQGQK